MPTKELKDQPCANTDIELWRERKDDYYADSIHVTESGAIGINCSGHVHVKPLRQWHELANHVGDANKMVSAPAAPMGDVGELVKRLQLGASISRDRKLNLDYAEVADQAAAALLSLSAQVAEMKAALVKIASFCPPDTTVDQLDDSPEMQLRLHNAEIGDTARSALNEAAKHLGAGKK